MTQVSRQVAAGLLLAAFTMGLVSACRHEEPNTIYMPDMVYTKAAKTQTEEAMRLPVKGTIPRGYHAYAFSGAKDAAEAAKLNTAPNPLLRTRANLQRGQKMFNTYCIVCHGPYGEGDGTIVPRFPRPPSLQSDKVRGLSDPGIFHVITRGQNLMPSYASQIDERDRWAIIHYVRVLQKAKHPTPDDLKAAEQLQAKGNQ